MSDTPPKYKWVASSSACSTCQSMATEEYTEKPARPHSKCQCSIVSISGNTHSGQTDPIPRIIDIVKTGGHTEYDEGSQKVFVEDLKEAGRENFSARGEFYYDVIVQCPKNNEIILHIVIEVEDGELYDILLNWGDTARATEDRQPPKDDFEQEINDALNDYSGGLEYKVYEKARAILASEGKDLCNQG